MQRRLFVLKLYDAQLFSTGLGYVYVWPNRKDSALARQLGAGGITVIINFNLIIIIVIINLQYSPLFTRKLVAIIEKQKRQTHEKVKHINIGTWCKVKSTQSAIISSIFTT